MASPVTFSSEMQSTGHAGTHNSHPVQYDSITVCINLLVPSMASVGQALMQSVQPMHHASSITATVLGPSSPLAAHAIAFYALQYAFGAARWALVDGNSLRGYGLGVGRAVRITTTCALGLGQCRQNPGDEFRHGSWVWPPGYFLRATFVATGFMTGLDAGLATAFTTGFAAVFVAARADLTPTEATFGFDTGDPLVVEAG